LVEESRFPSVRREMLAEKKRSGPSPEPWAEAAVAILP